jgi:hypothetical protein
MKKEFIPYELALELKQLGFNETCLASYYHAGRRLDICEYINHGEYTVLAPTFSAAFRFFREKYELSSWVYNSHTDKHFYTILQDGRFVKATESATTYEESELACLIRLIEIVKDISQQATGSKTRKLPVRSADLLNR